MPYSLRRESDNSGDSGSMSESIKFTEGQEPIIASNGRPTLGESMRVGSPFARSFSTQDWWLTTNVTEIIYDRGDEVKFKTGNSVYIWRDN